MLYAYWILLVLYTLLFFLYMFANQSKGDGGGGIEPWPALPDDIPDYDWTPPRIGQLPCERHDACPADHLCLGERCVPKYVKGGTCDPQRHGEWQSYDYNGARFAICVCLRPELFKQKHFGGDCVSSVACGAHGRHNLVTDACDCDYGYAPGPHYTCVRLPASQLEPCARDELRVDSSLSAGLHPKYLEKLLASDTKCVKRPCTFDPWTGRPLSKKARYEPGWGCVCDPRYGLVGIRLENVQYTTIDDDAAKGDNACVSVYKEPLQRPRNDVEVYQYFYLMRRAPVTLIRFRNVWKDDVANAFREHMDGGTTLTVLVEDWPRNFVQYVLKHERYDARTRQCQEGFFGTAYCNEEVVETDYAAPPCIHLEKLTQVDYSQDVKTTIYKQMYRYPVCTLDTQLTWFDIKLRGTHVLNPYHLIYDNEYFRTNGLMLVYRTQAGKWYLDNAPPYDIKLYKELAQQTNVPHISIGTPKVERMYHGILR